MHYLSDEELFGMIPQADGSHVRGNAEQDWYPSLKTAYEMAFQESHDFPSHLEFHGRGSTERKSKKDLKKNQKEGLLRAYEKGFPGIDKVLQKHTDLTNGYIFEFPSAQKRIYDHDDCEEFHYFKHGPDEYVPDTEKTLREAYEEIHSPYMRVFFWRLFWCLMATAAALLVLLGGRVYSLTPALEIWLVQSDKNAYIFTGILILLLQIVGWFVPAKRKELNFEDHTPAYFIMLGLITGWGLLYFPGTVGPAPEDGVVRIIYHIVKWPYLIYFLGVFVFHLVLWCREIPVAVDYYKNLEYNKKEYVRIYEEEVNKLRRYLRLRELWIEKEKVSTPMWLIYFENRLNKYRKEYEKNTK